METTKLRKYAQFARKALRDQVSNKLKFVLKEDSLARRESATAISKLESEIDKLGEDSLVEKVAYLWFNRICAFRFMDVNDYNKVRVISALPGNFQPESFTEAKSGFIEDGVLEGIKKERFYNLLNGTIQSNDPQQEAFRLLFIGYCNFYHSTMPYLFERVEDYTELLLPDDLLSGSSIIAYTCETLTPQMCEDVEVIGWLYQYYISEKKDEVFEGLKKKKKITPENIPAATQLFTPKWIVKYLVENSLGRLWMLNKPNSDLINHMEYYIKPEQEEHDFLKISSPEELKICDPACGSGHMLVYAFDILYSIYEDEGYQQSEIPGLILKNNLYGIDIDERAGELAAFALTMKARSKYKRFLKKPVQPNICVLEKIEFEQGELLGYKKELPEDLLIPSIEKTLIQFKDADNFGSLLKPIETNVLATYEKLKELKTDSMLLTKNTHDKVLKCLNMVNQLTPKYHVVVANPPYMGGKGMNLELSNYAKKEFPDSKSDLFAMFIERNSDLVVKKGLIGMVTMQSWMFLSSFEKLRVNLLNSQTILSMAHLGPRGFDSIGGEVVQTTAFVIENGINNNLTGSYFRLVDGNSEIQKDLLFKENLVKGPLKTQISSNVFSSISGHPILYNISNKLLNIFKRGIQISELSEIKSGLSSSDNDKYLRLHYEVSRKEINYPYDESFNKSWYLCNKGGKYKKWYGNNDYVIYWYNNGYSLKMDKKAVIRNELYYLKPSINWSMITTNGLAVRKSMEGCIFDFSSPSIFCNNDDQLFLASYLNSPIARKISDIINPTINLSPGVLGVIPLLEVGQSIKNTIIVNTELLIKTYKSDYDDFETSMDFLFIPLLDSKTYINTIEIQYSTLRTHWMSNVLEMKKLEEKNNDIFIKAYGLEGELDKDVPLGEITLNCNPYYRYGSGKTEEQLEGLLLLDTVKEFISYSVGCMFGRYSLDKEGLILANQGETLEDYLKVIPTPKFTPDNDNVVPIMAVDWFQDDIAVRFSEFLKVTFGEVNYEENIRFIEDALGYKTSGKSKPVSIREYFLKVNPKQNVSQFYKDHVKTYKKRPIYWLFSSPNGTFNVLIYMHRYTPETLDIILNDYLRDFSKKLSAHKENRERDVLQLTGAAKTKVEKEIKTLEKQIKEIDEYEREFYEFVSKGDHEIDLDDGVKVNYPKFGKLLNKEPGLR